MYRSYPLFSSCHFLQQWDLNTGQIVRRLTAHGAQLSALAVRPLASDFPQLAQGPLVNISVNTQAVSEDTKPSQLPSTQAKTEPLVTDLPTNLGGGSSALPSSSQQPHQQAPAPDVDSKSDASFDPLFDAEPDADGEADTFRMVASPTPEMKLLPQSLAMPASNSGPALHLPSTGPPVQTPQRPAPMPKNAPPLLDRVSCAAYSPDILMTAAMDGQVVLWDLRVSVPGPGRGVGRLWMSEKTPPWCLSVRSISLDPFLISGKALCWSLVGSVGLSLAPQF